MNITVSIPEGLAPVARKAAKELRPDLADEMTAKQIAETITRDFWKRLIVEYRERGAERTAQALNRDAIRAARELATADVETIT